jgi:EAL domain-containing protein (putative c-di-GMP-specific phosphodiesterase class I)
MRVIAARWRQSLVLSFTVMGVAAVAVLAVVLSSVVGHQIKSDALASARSNAQVIARSSFAPHLPRPGHALTASDRRELDAQVAAARSSQPDTEAALWDRNGRLLYSTAAVGARGSGTRVVGSGDKRRIRSTLPVLAGGAPAAFLQLEIPYASVANDITSRTRRLDVLLALTALAVYLLALPSLLRANRAIRLQYDPRRIELAHDLRRAIKNDGLYLAYQPIVDAKTGEVRAVEALVRWTDPRKGPISPAAFVPDIEKTDAIWDLTSHIFRLAFRQHAKWRDDGIELRIAVNVSGAVLLDRRLIPELRSLSAEFGLEPDALEIEITEGALVDDPQEATRVLNKISAIGLRVIAIDDFGTGYSSLSRLHELPLDTLKVDQSFVFRMAREGDASIVRSVVELAHALSLDVIAEGVEDEETATRLCELGCEYLQGYYYSRPQPAAEIAEWLSQRRLAAQLSASGFDDHTPSAA